MTDSHKKTKLFFSDFTLRTHPAGLQKNGVEVPLQSQPLRLLTLLVRRHGELVSHEEIRKYLWGDGHVEFASGIHVCIRHIRRALQDDGDRPKFVETIPRKGYRFVADVSLRPFDEEELEASRSEGRRATLRRIGIAGGLLAAVMLFHQVFQLGVPETGGGVQAPAADEAYLLGKQLLGSGEDGDAEAAIPYFEKAIESDGNFAPAYAGMALAYELLGDFRNARLFAQQSIATDTDYAEGHVRLAAVENYGHWNWEAAETSLLRALELVPERASVRIELARIYLIRGRIDEARQAIQAAIALESTTASLLARAGSLLYLMGVLDDAMELCEAALNLDPDHLASQRCLYRAALVLRDDELAMRHAVRLMADLGGTPAAVGAASDLSPRLAVNAFERWRIDQYQSAPQAKLASPLDLAISFAVVRKFDESFFYLVRAHKERHPEAPMAFLDPIFIPLRHQSRYEQLADDIGIIFPAASNEEQQDRP